MGLIDLFTSKKVKEFARTLADDLAKRYPPSMESGSERRMSAKGVSNIIEGLCVKAVDFSLQNKLGFYKKAKLGNTFRWELKSLGYSDEFIEVATEGLIVYLTRGEQPTPPTNTDSQKR